MNSHYNGNDDTRRIVLDYFRLINEKNILRLLNLFTDDCVIYEPLGKGPLLYNSREEKTCLKGKPEIESFLNIVMMAVDGLQSQIEFLDEPIDMNYNQPSDIFDSTSSSSTIVSALATFYEVFSGGIFSFYKHGINQLKTSSLNDVFSL